MTGSANISGDRKMQRNGSYFRVVVFVLFFVGATYFVYLYNASLGRLRDAEARADHYRREGDSKGAELQQVLRDTDEQSKQFSIEKREMSRNMDMMNQRLKLMKAQHDELRDHDMKQQLELNRQRDEYSEKEAQLNMEVQKQKQEINTEVTNLKEQLAAAEQKAHEFQGQNQVLKTELQHAQQQVTDKDEEIQEQLKMIKHLSEQVQQHQDTNLRPDSHQQQQQPFPGWDMGRQQPVANMEVENSNDPRLRGPGGDTNAQTGEGQGQANNQQGQQEQNQPDMGFNNEHHQILPPDNKEQHPGLDEEGEKRPADQKDDEEQEDVEDDQHQVMKPNLGSDVDKDQQAEEDVAADRDFDGMDNKEHQDLEHPQNEGLGALHDPNQDLGRLQNDDPLGLYEKDHQWMEKDNEEEEVEDMMQGRQPVRGGQWNENPADQQQLSMKRLPFHQA